MQTPARRSSWWTDRATRSALAALMIAAAPAAVGCGGATFRDGIYENDHTRYRVGQLGPGWQRVDVDGNDLAFESKDMGTISVNSTCTDYEDVPAAALVNHLLFDTTNRHFLTEETVTLDGRGAVHAVVQAELDGVPMEIEVYVLKKDGCVYDLGHIRTPSTPASARQQFAAFVQRFAVLQVKDG